MNNGSVSKTATAGDNIDAEAGPEAPPARTLKILSVDDKSINQLVLKTLFEYHELEAEFADNGAEAVSLCRERPFDVVLMDIHMPVMDGVGRDERDQGR